MGAVVAYAGSFENVRWNENSYKYTEFPNDHDCYPSVNMEPTNIIITIIGTWTIFNIVIGTLGNLFTIIGLSFSAKRKM